MGAVGVALAAAAGSLAIMVGAALPQEAARSAETAPAAAMGATPAFTYSVQITPYHGRPVRVFSVAQPASGNGQAPAPPGTSAMPNAGEAFVSPALASALEKDPSLAGRVPGSIVGTIKRDGLSSPNALSAIVGVDENAATTIPAVGWGSQDPVEVMGQLPAVATLSIEMLLVGLPWATLVIAVGQVVARRLRKPLGLLSLIGLAEPELASVARWTAMHETAPCALAGAAVGAAGTAIVGPTGLLGVSFFAPSLPLIVLQALASALLCVAVTMMVGHVAARRVARSDSAAVRRKALTTRRWPALVGLAGVAALVVMYCVRTVSGSQVQPSDGLTLAFVVAVMASAFGLAVGLSHLLKIVARHLSSRHRPALLTALRQSSFDAVSSTVQTCGVVVLACAFMISGAVQQLLDDQDPTAVRASSWTVSLPEGQINQAVRAAVAAGGHSSPVLSRVSGNGSAASMSTEVWGLCADLRRVAGTIDINGETGCTDGTDYAAGAVTTTTSDDGSLPNTWGQTTVHTYAAAAAASHQAKAIAGTYFLSVVMHDPDREISQISAAASGALFNADAFNTENLIAIPRFRAMSTSFLAVGLLLILAALAYSLGKSEAIRATERHLADLGASNRFVRHVDALRTLSVTLAAAVVALLVGALSSQTYLALGSVYRIDRSTIRACAILLIVLVAAATCLSAMRPVGHRLAAEATADGRPDGGPVSGRAHRPASGEPPDRERPARSEAQSDGLLDTPAG